MKTKDLDEEDDNKLNDEDTDDTEYEGDNTVWKVIVRAWSNDKEWCDTTMAMQLPNGIVMRTQYTTDDGMGDAESMVFIPGVKLKKNEEGNWIIE